MESKRNSRWNNKPKRGPDGKPKPFQFVASDFPILQLLSPDYATREPWSYRRLPSSYITSLLDRGRWGGLDRLRDLAVEGYVCKPEQPLNNFRPLIFGLGKKGERELHVTGASDAAIEDRRLAHELMRCICAASFEVGARKHNLPLSFEPVKTHIRPDWPSFRLDNHLVFLEADVDSETLYSNRPNTTKISGKMIEYLDLIVERRLKDAMVLFITVDPVRCNSMIEVLKRVIDERGFDHKLAAQFGFTHIDYNRYIDRIPKLTDWAVRQKWQRAGRQEPFCFI
jgi:hypothetical protein